MIVIRVLSGKVRESGRLSLGTVAKLQLARFLARCLQAKMVTYKYIFPQGRQEGQGGQRPCDVMSLWIKQRDPYAQVVVPGGDWDYRERFDRLLFVKQVATINQAQKVVPL